MSVIRLQKFLSMAGVCSRRKGEEYIKDGLVKVNGNVVTTLGTKVDADNDSIEFRNRPVKIEQNIVYIALNKPQGYVSTCRKGDGKIILDLVDINQRIYPVGRLDKDSTGLLLLTNDGNLHQNLSHPSFDHEKEYDVITGKPVSDEALIKMAEGMPLRGTKTRPAEIKRLSANRFLIVLKEGRNRQIRRMVKKVEGHVVKLKRVRISNIKLGNLPEGSWRYLTEKEKKGLMKSIKKNNAARKSIEGS
ncbi:MAG: rRNA pseudouridine synthase [Desulfobacteraceae bacterium]|nr:rRNA pseudouridine synthase [Desulfobacteraceae bacterium]